MSDPLVFTANDTQPTVLAYSTTDPVTRVTTYTDITGYTVQIEIDYGTEVLVVTAAPLDPPQTGKCCFAWEEGDLREGEWEARIVTTNAQGKKLSSDLIRLSIGRDLTPPVVP